MGLRGSDPDPSPIPDRPMTPGPVAPTQTSRSTPLIWRSQVDTSVDCTLSGKLRNSLTGSMNFLTRRLRCASWRACAKWSPGVSVTGSQCKARCRNCVSISVRGTASSSSGAAA